MAPLQSGDGRLRRANQLGQLALAETPRLAQGADLAGQADRPPGLVVPLPSLGAVSATP